MFLPYEIYDLAGKVTWLQVAALVINLLLVIYLVWTKRLFGARGGKAAYQARLRSESVIEAEQAALTAASPGPASDPAPASTVTRSPGRAGLILSEDRAGRVHRLAGAVIRSRA